ncbi:hypothetical protein [Lactobacillus sp. ESL0681]|uniref:hypothetical protein n=1 Tax=Lactobacillus sp. ESL0681 TaxID=2983211 RepID=UPI0023F8940A|nr:hypothetical protein [Lactobacillus sp. ESL0681]WEV39795.1 hypothetical protein OZX59_06180 [Lactobacillus sp. ESL0681]
MFNSDIEKIKDPETKKYLKEVISSLENKNYRSAIVMLYVVIIIDLISKLRELRDFKASKRATNILNSLNNSNTKAGYYESIENTLIDKIMKRKSNEDQSESVSWLLSDSALATINCVKSYRNLCAHPSFDKNISDKLIEPSKELVTGLIRSCFDNIFLRSANFGKDVFSTLTDDLAQNKDYFIKLGNDSLKEYLITNYLNRFNDDTYKYIVSNLFKETFCRDRDIENQNRKINYTALTILIHYDFSKANDALKNSIYYNQILKNDDVDHYLSLLFRSFPSLYSDIPSYYKDELKRYSTTTSTLQLENFFIDSSDIIQHENKIFNSNWYKNCAQELTTNSELDNLYLIYSRNGNYNNFYKLLNSLYASAYNFNVADTYFKLFITPYLNKYDKESILDLISKADKNDQCYARNWSKYDHRQVFEALNNVLKDPLSEKKFKQKYPNFCCYWN